MSEVSYPRSRPRTRPLLLRDPVPTSPPRNPIRATPIYYILCGASVRGRASRPARAGHYDQCFPDGHTWF